MKRDTRKKREIKGRWNTTPEKKEIKINGRWNATPYRKKERDICIKKDKRKGEREVRLAFILMFHLFAYPVPLHSKHHHKKNSWWIVPKLLKHKLFFLFLSLRLFYFVYMSLFFGVENKIICILNCTFLVVFIFGLFKNIWVIVFPVCLWLNDIPK